MPVQEDYTVALDAFQGPLDLLLYLIRRAEVDVQEIPIARVTDQYLAFLARADRVDIDFAGEFLVMAATLIEIKSRTLAPPAAEGEEGADAAAPGALDAADPRYELVQQLLAYQRYRTAAERLQERREQFAWRFPNRPARGVAVETHGHVDDGDEDDDLELEDVHLLDLSQAYEHMVSSIDFDKLGDHLVELDDTPIELHQEDLLDRLHHTDRRRLLLQDIFGGHTPGQRIGLFLATLELVRLRRVTVTQPEIESPIEVVLNEDPEENAETSKHRNVEMGEETSSV